MKATKANRAIVITIIVGLGMVAMKIWARDVPKYVYIPVLIFVAVIVDYCFRKIQFK